MTAAEVDEEAAAMGTGWRRRWHRCQSPIGIGREEEPSRWGMGNWDREVDFGRQRDREEGPRA